MTTQPKVEQFMIAQNENKVNDGGSKRRIKLARGAALFACASAVTLALAACGGSDDTAQNASDMQGQGMQGRGMAGSGEVVQVSGSTAQVRNERSGQAAVTWNSNTDFTKSVTGSASDLKVGKCVVAMASSESSDTASTVQVTDKVDGSCQSGGMPGGPGGNRDSSDRPQPPSGDAPEGAPSDMPSGGPQGGFGNITIGEIKSVSNGKIVVAAVEFTPPNGNDQNTEQASPTTADKTVTLNSSTKVIKTVSAKAADVAVGKCVVTRGESDSTGKITATNIAISSKVDGECSMGGFGGARPGGTSSPSSSN